MNTLFREQRLGRIIAGPQRPDLFRSPTGCPRCRSGLLRFALRGGWPGLCSLWRSGNLGREKFLYLVSGAYGSACLRTGRASRAARGHRGRRGCGNGAHAILCHGDGKPLGLDESAVLCCFLTAVSSKAWMCITAVHPFQQARRRSICRGMPE